MNKKAQYFIKCVAVILLLALNGCDETDPDNFLDPDITLDEAQEQLSKIQADINKIAADKSCANAGSCKIYAYGRKACGGPSTYIIYGSGVNESLLISRCNDFTNYQAEINQRFPIFSTCDLLHIPEITCENGMCVAKP